MTLTLTLTLSPLYLPRRLHEGSAAGGRREGAREGPSPFGANLKSEREGERAMRKHHGEICGDTAGYCEMLRDVG